MTKQHYRTFVTAGKINWEPDLSERITRYELEVLLPSNEWQHRWTFDTKDEALFKADRESETPFWPGNHFRIRKVTYRVAKDDEFVWQS